MPSKPSPWPHNALLGTERGRPCCSATSGLHGLETSAPDVKCSMMAANTSGFSMLHARSSFLVTVTKSDPKNTLVTPSIANRRLASGDAMPSRAFEKSLLPACTGPESAHRLCQRVSLQELLRQPGHTSDTAWPGRNIKLAGFGVGCVCMNMPRCCTPALAATRFSLC